MREDIRKRGSGRRVRTDRCDKLEIDDWMVVIGTTEDASKHKRVLPTGVQVQLKGLRQMVM